MNQSLFVSIVLSILTFLSFSSVDSMEGEMWRGLKAKIKKLSAGCSVQEDFDEDKEELIKTSSTVPRVFLPVSKQEQLDEGREELIACTSSVVSHASLPTLNIRIEAEALCIDGSFNVFGKGAQAPLSIRCRTACDEDFVLPERKYIGPATIDRLHQDGERDWGSYSPVKFGPITIQRGDPRLMEYIINGPRSPRETIDDHWLSQASGWKRRLYAAHPATIYVVEEETAEGGKDFKGHFLLGALSPTELVLSVILEEENWRKGIGEGLFHYVLEVLIPGLCKNSLTKDVMRFYGSLVILVDDKNPIAPVLIRKIQEFQSENPHYSILQQEGVRKEDTRPRYAERTRYQWTFVLDSFKK